MYYNNKSTFYVKQYGPAVIISIVSILLIGTGAFIYFKTSGMDNPFKNNMQIADSTQDKVEQKKEENKPKEELIVEKNAVVEDNIKNEVATTSNPKYFDELPLLEKSKISKITNISKECRLTIEVDDAKVELSMIGVDYKNSNLDVIIEKLKTDLLNKDIRIAFDTVKSDNGMTYGYIYKENKLYNSELLKTGLVTLKTERKNNHLNKDLAAAQAYARENSLGIWKK